MPLVPIAAFLVGALLTILLPIGLLCSLAAWYWLYAARVPETGDVRKSGSDPAAATPAPEIPEALPPDPAL